MLTVIASASSVWAWLAAADTDAGALTEATAARPAIRVAVGPAGAGVNGFRRSHFDAVATQRLMSRRPDLRGHSASWPMPARTCATRCACTSASSSAPPAPCTPTATIRSP